MAGRHSCLALAIVCLAASRLRAQACDPDLAGRGTGTLGYQQRGARCEGVYRRLVAGTVLYLVSLTESFDFDQQAAGPLKIRWPDAGGDTVRLRAEALRPDLFYRMDARATSGSRDFDWPTDVLSALRLGRPDVGVVAYATRQLGAVAQPVYLPLRIAQGERPAPCGPMRMVLWPGVRLDSVTMAVAPVNSSGTAGAWIRREELGLGYYPAETPITVAAPPLAAGAWVFQFVAYPRGAAPVPVRYVVQRNADGCGS